MTVFGLLACEAAHAADVTDAVPGHPGVTYEMLLKQAVASLAKDANGNWTALSLQTLRGTDGKIEPDTDISFNSVESLTVREDGRRRLILLTGDSQMGGSFAAILAAYDDSQPIPKLLDFLDGGGDRFVQFSSPALLTIAPDTDAFIGNVNHFNSGQNYTSETIYFLHHGKIAVATSQFTLNQDSCGYEMRQVPAHAVHDDRGAKYRAVTVSVTQTTRRTGETCDPGTRLPRFGAHTYTDVYRWDAKKDRYVSHTNAMTHLMRPDE